jgi:NTE family protein
MPEIPTDRLMSSMSMAGALSPFAALEQCTLFDGLDTDTLARISERMRPVSFHPGAEISRAGKRGETMFLIVEGVAQAMPGTGDQRVVSKQRRGDVIGATSLVTGDRHTVTVVASSYVSALEMSRKDFERLMEEHPAVVVNFTKIMRRRLLRAYQGATEEESRGEAVGLIFSSSLADLVPRLVEAASAASPRKVDWLDTRSGFHEAVASIDEMLETHATVVVAARAEGRSAPQLGEHTDRIVVLADGEQGAQRVAHMDELEGKRIELVLVEDEPGRRQRRMVGKLPVVRSIERGAEDGSLPPADVAWLGRHLSRTKLGLALGAGGAKGYAHVGVLEVLERAGYVVDYVAGSSIGAIVGAYVAMGMDAAEVDRRLREAFSPENVAELFQLSLAGASKGLETIEQVFRETTRGGTFDDLEIPLVAMAVDLSERRPSPISEGRLWEALMAATALAGMAPPYERDGHRLVDGLALVPVPTGSAYEAGADVVVSVNLMPRETLPAWPGQEPPPPKEEKKQGVRMLETILEVNDLSAQDGSIRHAELADVVLHPRFGPGSWRDFHLADLFLAAGREALEEQLPALKGLSKPQPTQVTEAGGRGIIGRGAGRPAEVTT